MAKQLTSVDVTEEMIRALRTDAGEAGDTTLVRTCDRALGGADADAFRTVLHALNDARAQESEIEN